MAPRTRSSTQTPASAQAPPSRVYRSAPKPQQARFPPRNKSIKTYGRRQADLLTQQTVTQMDFLVPVDPEEMESLDKDRPKKRRKTLGDSPAAPTSSFHTQTLTQFMSSKEEEDDGGLQILDSEDEDDFLLPEDVAAVVQSTQTREVFAAPQTPAKKQIKTEIPSSQASPSTPALDKYKIQPRSPLTEKSTNIPTPNLSVANVGSKRPRTMVIQDSFDTVPSSLGSDKPWTPSARTPLATIPCSQTRPSLRVGLGKTGDIEILNVEISDSDDDFGSLGPTPRKSSTVVDSEAEDASEAENDAPGGPSPHIRPPSQTPVVESETPLPLQHGSTRLARNAPAGEMSSGPPSPSARKALHRAVISSGTEIEKETPISSPHRTTSPTTIKSQALPSSQALESQRVPLDVLRALGPQTDRSDIIVSIPAAHVAAIAAGTRTHELRPYRIPNTVCRFWIYEPHPGRCQLLYMATVGPAAETASAGGTAEAPAQTFAYELLQVYELNNPVALHVMRRNGWVDGPPARYAYVPPAVVGQLLANLRWNLFEEDEDEALQLDLELGEDDGVAAGTQTAGPATVSQEVEEQLRSEHTQQQLGSDGVHVIIPSSQPRVEFATPARAARGARAAASGAGAAAKTRPSQATTASQPSQWDKASSSGMRLLPVVGAREGEEGESPLEDGRTGAASLGSSQLLLPASLYEDARRAPVILDSEDEELA